MKKILSILTVALGVLVLGGCVHQYLATGPSLTTYANTTSSYQLKKLQWPGVQVIEAGDHLHILLASDSFFLAGTDIINTKQAPILAKIAALLIKSRDSGLLVIGHTDNVGTSRELQKLSLMQAHSIAAYLWSQGVPLNAMKVLGYADAQPIASNDTTRGRSFNRRVDILVRMRT